MGKNERRKQTALDTQILPSDVTVLFV